jgi:hypothetical protein
VRSWPSSAWPGAYLESEAASLNVAGHIDRSGDVFEVERDETSEQWLRAGAAVEVKTAGRESARRKAPGTSPRGKER